MIIAVDWDVKNQTKPKKKQTCHLLSHLLIFLGSNMNPDQTAQVQSDKGP